MTELNSGRDRLWSLSGQRCAICHRSLSKPGEHAGPDQFPAVEWPIAHEPSPADGYNDAVLLCQMDAATVTMFPERFPDRELRRLKGQVEHLFAQRVSGSSLAGGSARVRLLAHIAGFIGSQVPFFFLKVVNDSLKAPVRINQVWFDTEPATHVNNPDRLLPTMLGPGETFETWIRVQDVPPAPDVLTRARVSLGDGSIVASIQNTTFAPTGMVSGGGIPLSEIYVESSYVHSPNPSEWDVFISYASEDKDEVAQPLYQALNGLGLSVWYDDSTLRIGDSLRRKIDTGVGHSAFGVVIVSPSYIRKGWTQYEFDGIMAMTVDGKQRLLPIWHQITKEEILAYSPSLVDKVARSTSDFEIVEIANEIAERVRSATFT
jgi:TIR domain